MPQEDFTILHDTPYYLVEIDNKTGKKIIWNKVDGRIDNAAYLRVHKDDYLQPVGSTEKEFARRYPERNVNFKKFGFNKVKI